MKQVIIICAMAAISSLTNAQTQHWDESTGRTVNTGNQANKFSDIEMEADGKLVTFSHVPEMPQEIRVVITNAQGDQVAEKAITPLSHVMDLHSLRKGSMYFVTLVCNGKTQKAFTLHL